MEEEYCPDRESSSSSGGEESSEEREVCMICLRASSGEWAHPCDCAHGIALAHRTCFDAYRNSWPIGHPNRSMCPYCQTPYLYDLVVQDTSQHRQHGYVVCYTATATAVLHTLFVLILSPLLGLCDKLPVCLYLTNIYNVCDLILTNQGVATIDKKWCGNTMVLVMVSCCLIFLDMFRAHYAMIMYDVIICAVLAKRLFVIRVEMQQRV